MIVVSLTSLSSGRDPALVIDSSYGIEGDGYLSTWEGSPSSALFGLVEGSTTHLVKAWNSAQDASLWPSCPNGILSWSLHLLSRLYPSIDDVPSDEGAGSCLTSLQTCGRTRQRRHCGPLRQRLPCNLGVLINDDNLPDRMYGTR